MNDSIRSRKSRKVLFLAYLFPPVGGVGVQRSLKFVKYLPATGWNPIVLTVLPVSYYVYDSDLLEELPGSVKIIRTHSLDPLRVSSLVLGDKKRAERRGKSAHPIFRTNSRLIRVARSVGRLFLFPDVKIGWIPFALWAGIRAIRRDRPDVIYSPEVPYSSTLIAYLLSKLTGVPYVIDFRDGWLDDAYNIPPTSIHRAGHRKLERRVVTSAAQIVVYGKWLADRLIERYPSIIGRVTEITNGFDPADDKGLSPAPKAHGKRRIVYVGSLHLHHRDSFETVLQAVSGLPTEMLQGLELLIVGQAFAEAPEVVKRFGLDAVVRFLGYLPHATALSYLQSADASLLLVRKGDFASMTGKVFELLMTRAPIWALAEHTGECARVLRLADAAQWLAEPDDAEGALKTLRALFAKGFPRNDSKSLDLFNRQKQAERLGIVLEAATQVTND